MRDTSVVPPLSAELTGRYTGPTIKGTREIALVSVTQLMGNFSDACVRTLKQFVQHFCACVGNNARVCLYAILGEIINDLEVRVRETLNTTSEDQLAPRDGENFYRLLGAYRGVSEATGDYVASTDAIHWSRWKEEKIVL